MLPQWTLPYLLSTAFCYPKNLMILFVYKVHKNINQIESNLIHSKFSDPQYLSVMRSKMISPAMTMTQEKASKHTTTKGSTNN